MVNARRIVKKVIPVKLFNKIEPIGHLGEAVLANIRYGSPSKKMHIIGVTGTNGKTTTTFLIARMLHEAGYKVGMLSTVAYGIGNDIQPQIEHMTTAQSGILQKRLADFRDAGVEWVVLETSSHSLAQHRVWGIPYEIAVMTNVTNDHLDYHGTFESYLNAKLGLFRLANKHGRKFGVVNADDPNAYKFVDSIKRSVTYGIESGELRASMLFLAPDHSTFEADIGEERYNIRVNIPGKFNISNALAAVTVGREVGLSKQQIEDGIAATTSVEGRMSVIDEGQDFKVIVDFASTPDAFEKLFASLKPLVRGKLIAVFGSAGRRDEAKRPAQGEIAANNSDEIVLTEEDDRDIDGNQILEEIATGARRAGKVDGQNLFKVLNREEAIKFAFSRATSPNDVVVLLGKGHEKTIERADGEHLWNESEVARNILRSSK